VSLVCTALTLYTLVLFIRIILSWVTMAWSPPPSLSPVIGVIYDLTEPVMGFFRRYIPSVGGLDLSPLIIFFVLGLIRNSIGC
jgi:YggT family protein